MYKMTLNFPNLAKGTEVQIDGLGVFDNGYEYTITSDEAEAYRVHNQVVQTELDDDGNSTVTADPGATLLQAFKGNKSVKVVKMSDEELKALEPANNDVDPNAGNDTNQEGEGS